MALKKVQRLGHWDRNMGYFLTLGFRCQSVRLSSELEPRGLALQHG